MSEKNLQFDLAALALLALVIFLSLSLLTYDPADPLMELVRPFSELHYADQLVYPPNAVVQNACGPWGALAADILLGGLGVGAYYFVLSLGVLDTFLLRRRPLDAPVVRALGWLLSLAGLVTLAAILVPGLTPGPVIGSGGYFGAFTSRVFDAHFALAGSLILSLSLLAGGLLLCTDYALLHAAAWLLAKSSSGRRLLPVLPKWKRASKPQANVVLNVPQAAAEENEFSVRIRGKQVAETPAVEEEQEEEEDVDETEEEADEEEEEEVAEEATAPAATQSPESAPAPAKPSEVRVKRQKERNERQEVMASLDQASLVTDEATEYELPDLNLLTVGDDICFDEQAKEVRRKAKILEKTFADFGFNVKVVEIETGPVIAQYEVELEAGLRLSKITGLADDLAIALRVPSVRIVAPIPGKNTVGIEVPNETRQVVRLREVIEESNGKTKKMRIPIFLGKDVSGNPLTVDLSTLPHLLIAGRTGTGKSVCLNAIISSILMTKRPDEVRMLMIDPKMVELSCYGRLPHLMHPVVTDMRKAEAILAWAVEKMEERYALLARAGVRHISVYNQLGAEELYDRLDPEDEEQKKAIPVNLPYIVIVADEMADLMMTAGKEVEQHIIRLAQKSRAVGIHLILATQKPTVDVITGLIKSNLPARIAFQVASRTDSRVVLDEMGADKLLGNGDMLFLWPGTSTLIRGQGTYLSDEEINAVVECVSTGEQNFVHELVNLKVEQPGGGAPEEFRKRDELYESAIDIVVREGRGSVSLLQRALGIGYGRAARLIDFMAEDNIVGPYAGSNDREVLISIEDWERMQGASAGPSQPEATPAPTARRTNKIRPEPEPVDDDATVFDGDESFDADDADFEGQLDGDVDDNEEYEEDSGDAADEAELWDEEEPTADDGEELEEDEEEEYAEEEYEEDEEEALDEDQEEDDAEEPEPPRKRYKAERA